MTEICNALCIVVCVDLSLDNLSLDVLWTCLKFMCTVTVEDQQRTPFVNNLSTIVLAVMNANSSSNCTFEEAYLLKMVIGYTVQVRGYLFPVITLLTIINNTLVCIVLLKPHMRSPVNVILVHIALSNAISVILVFPVSIYFYATERVHEWIPYNWCYAIEMLENDIPVIFTRASIWLTILLGILRYICVCHPFKARIWCTMHNVKYGICAIYFFATLIEIPIFFKFKFIETRRRSRNNPSVMVSACVIRLSPWIAANERIYFNIYFGFKLIFSVLVLCLTLVVLNTLLVYTMRKAMKRRIELLRQDMKSESQQMKETNSTTLMLVTVMVLLLLTVVPSGIFGILMFTEYISDIIIFTPLVWSMLILFNQLFFLLSYTINFYIYCFMSKEFRDTLKNLFKCD